MNEEHSLMAVSAIQHEVMCCFNGLFQCAVLPSVLYRPNLSVDGNQWCALYGENLQEGVAGFGDSPEKAMLAFNENWYKPLQGVSNGD